jgi:drug/metabolite transporter (DMT)-like permease
MIKTRESQGQPSAPSVEGSSAAADWLGWTLAILATVAFSIAAPVARSAIVSGMDPTLLLMMRLLLAVPLLAGFTAFTSPDRLKVDRRALQLNMFVGSVGSIGMLLFFWSLARLDASVASMTLSIVPLVVLLLLALRGEKFTHRNLVRVALGLSGIYLLIGPGGQVDPIGVALVFVAVILFAVQLVFTQWFLQAYDARTIALFITVAMTIVVICTWVAQGATWHDPGLNGWLAIGALAVVSTCLARIAFYGAIRQVGSGQMALLMPLETLLTVIWSVLFLHERLSPVQWLGGVLILTSALLAIRRLGRARWRPRWRAWVRL